MRVVLVAVDDFTEDHLRRVRKAVEEWALVRQIPQGTSPEQYRAEIQAADIVVGWPEPKWLLGSRVQLLQIGSSGWDVYEHAGLENCGIAICSGRGIYSTAVAEHCIAMMLALARRLPVHVRDRQQRVFCRHPPYQEVAGTTACIVGVGSIGMQLAARCRGLGMRVVGVFRGDSQQFPDIDEMFSGPQLKLAVSKARHVFMTAPGNAENKNLFSREVLEAFSPGTYFYNVSRGSTVDEIALCEFIANGRIGGAGLDVTMVEPLPATSPLWDLGDNVLITGHSAGLSGEYPERFCELAIRNLTRFHRGDPLENRVL